MALCNMSSSFPLLKWYLLHVNKMVILEWYYCCLLTGKSCGLFEFLCSPNACLSSPQVLWLPNTVQKHNCWVNWSLYIVFRYESACVCGC